MGIPTPARVLALAFALGFGATVAHASWESAPRGFVVLRDQIPGSLHAFADALEAAGGHASVFTSPRTVVVYADDATLAAAGTKPWVSATFRGKVDDEWMASAWYDTRRAAEAWNASLDLPDPGSGEPQGNAAPDAGPRPSGVLSMAPSAPRTWSWSWLPYGADYYDTSEFMAGSAAVGVWLLEAPGLQYDWIPAEENLTIGGVQAGLDKWVQKGGAPASLTFYLDVHRLVPVNGVPIQNPMGMDQQWVNYVLGNAGWPGANGFERCFAYNNAIRDLFYTNWCYSIFIVDSDPNINQGLFSGGGYAWAYYGGPWIYMARYSSWAFNAGSYYGVVPMHESGHIFMDTDEYDTNVQYAGYLNVPDQNGARCIMNRNDSTTVCNATRNQLGWRDFDGDGIIDILDTPPVTMLDVAAPDPTSDPTPTWTGSAHVTFYPNQNPVSNYYPPHPQTINTIQSIECRIDGGSWQPATTADGWFHGYEQSFSWTAPPLADGLHVIEAHARNSVGNWSAIVSDSVVVSGSPLSVESDANGLPARLRVFAPCPNPARAGAEIRFALARACPVRAEVLDLAGRRIRTIAAGAPRPAGVGTLAWDGRDDSGARVRSGVYLVRVSAGGEASACRVAIVD